MKNGILSTEDAPRISSHLKEMENAKNKDFLDADIVWSPKHIELAKVEEYILEKFPIGDLHLSYDVTAIEPLYFNTINYTTYAGCFLLHPLNFEQCLRQMADAYSDNIKLDYGHLDYIKDSFNKEGSFSKYVFDETVDHEPAEALVVLTGGNKLKKHSCAGKLKQIVARHGRDNVLFKKHPVSYDDIYDELSDYLGGIRYADKKSDLSKLVNQSEYIYTSLLTESTLLSFVLGKKVDHYDKLQNRNTASFGHIGYYLFTTPDPVAWASQAFASPKSGIINPAVDLNWKQKIDDYIDYITQLRGFYKDAYIWQ